MRIGRKLDQLLPQRLGDLANQFLREQMVAFWRQMFTIGLMRQSPEHAVRQNNNSDSHCGKPTLNSRGAVSRPFSSIISARLQNHNARSLCYDTIEPGQHSPCRVSVDAGVDDVDAHAPCTK